MCKYPFRLLEFLRENVKIFPGLGTLFTGVPLYFIFFAANAEAGPVYS